MGGCGLVDADVFCCCLCISVFVVHDDSVTAQECGSDPTCIMCAACFKNSPCVGHAFRLVRSGGGSCDCGDKDAWKPESFCKAHSQCSMSSAPTQSEKGLAARAYVRKVFTASCAPFVKSEVYMNNEVAEVVFAWCVALP